MREEYGGGDGDDGDGDDIMRLSHATKIISPTLHLDDNNRTLTPQKNLAQVSSTNLNCRRCAAQRYPRSDNNWIGGYRRLRVRVRVSARVKMAVTYRNCAGPSVEHIAWFRFTFCIFCSTKIVITN